MYKIVRDLNELFTNQKTSPFVIGIAKISMKGVTDLSIPDYFVLRISESKATGTRGNIEIQDLSDTARKEFLQNLHLFELVQDNKDGRVYEVKGRVGYFKSKVRKKPKKTQTKYHYEKV